MDPCSHLQSYWNGQNIINILGKSLLYRPYLSSTLQNPFGKLPVSAWILVNGSMLPHGIIIEWSKYHKKILKERYLRQTITISTKNTKYNARSIWKFACNCMDFGKWIHAHTWNQILMVSVCNPSYCPKTESHPSPFLFFWSIVSF
jgi:hypothetical protein